MNENLLIISTLWLQYDDPLIKFLGLLPFFSVLCVSLRFMKLKIHTVFFKIKNKVILVLTTHKYNTEVLSPLSYVISTDSTESIIYVAYI